MKLKYILSAIFAIAISPALTISAQNETQNILPPVDTPELQEAEDDFTPVAPESEELDPEFSVKERQTIISENERFWKKNNILVSVGFATGSFDLGKYNGGELSSRWGLGFKAGRNIMLHKKPIANVLKFGLFIGGDLTYLNFKKGHGSLSGLIGGGDHEDYDDDYDDGYDDYEDDDTAPVALGTHYLAAGLAIGPTATLMPFYWSSNSNLARLKLRPYFQVVPSYSALLVSDDDDLEVHGAFACLFAGGFEVIWRKLSIGFEWKGGRARYKDLVGDIMDDLSGVGNVWVGAGERKQPRYGCKMFTVSIGLEF